MGIEVGIVLAIGIGVAGYYIGSGIKYGLVYFKSGKLNEDEKNEESQILYNDLIKEKEVHSHLGISKEDAKELIKKYPDIPHIELNGNIYFVRKGLREWINKFNKTK